MKIILLGRGASCLRCDADFVNSHDLIVITNKFVFRGYEQYVGNRADIQFRNGTCEIFNQEDIEILGLKKIIYTHANNTYPKYPAYYDHIEKISPRPPICYDRVFKDFAPSTGIQAFYYLLKNYAVTELSLVGFDFHEKGQRPYYFQMHEAEPQLRYLWKTKYKGDIVNVESGHSPKQAARFVNKIISRSRDVKFNIITNSKNVDKSARYMMASIE